MTKTLFTDDWTFHREGDVEGVPVRLPHDAMIGEPRVAQGGTDNHGGFFPGGVYVYRKRWTAPQDVVEREYFVEFEGVFGECHVVVDGVRVGGSTSPYRAFRLPLGVLTPGSASLIEVHVDNSAVPNSRWYTGSGIYRPVWLDSVGAAAIAQDGISIVTTSVDGGPRHSDASVDVSVRVRGALPPTAQVVTEFSFDGQLVARRKSGVQGGIAALDVPVPSAHLWSADRPALYDVRVSLVVDGVELDSRSVRSGIRTIGVDARNGLRVNGRHVLLRGTAVHHDNGPLGAATFAAAERRRARLLKEAGYNAIRSAHNPLSRAFLDACDEIGLYVMDELSDVWFGRKTPHDGAPLFRGEWRADAAAMIQEDRNRPSVIMYSIGNEIAEAAVDAGVDLAEEITSFFTELDPTRPTTIAVNPLLAMMSARAKPSDDHEEKPLERTPATSTAANMLTAKLGRMMVLASTLPAADKATRAVFDRVDIAGYNYGFASYARARRRYPDRVIVGTESMHGDLPAIWKRVTSVAGVIGDFSWTGWDYLGEVGLGYWTYGSEPGGIAKPFPGVLAGCGAFDITGSAGATVLLAQAVWGITAKPGIAVRSLDRAGQRANKTPWLATDAVQSWSWRGHSGVAEVEVYSGDDHVELLINGRSLGRRTAGPKRGYLARFRVPYEPGELVAIGYRRGVESGRSSLRSAAPARVRLRAETDELHGPDDLAYVWVELADDDGIVEVGAEDRVTVSVSGAGTLAAVGSATPSTSESLVASTRTTYRGRAIAIVRGANESGDVVITVTSERHGETAMTIHSLGAEPTAAPVGATNTEETSL
ncbi:glycoside hydrolase family 2 TIM barrel-domain containing protein [Marisediminicola sp. LYQ134]|uniref:glycoside hydrolase family 2 TIM barrel-domain containing protein n=1 Tax=Marisediminicola sp. LYQ134 TaxID=3391061 RepID=UPI003982FF7C